MTSNIITIFYSFRCIFVCIRGQRPIAVIFANATVFKVVECCNDRNTIIPVLRLLQHCPLRSLNHVYQPSPLMMCQCSFRHLTRTLLPNKVVQCKFNTYSSVYLLQAHLLNLHIGCVIENNAIQVSRIAQMAVV